MITDLILLLFSIFIDVNVSFYWGSLKISPHFSTILILYFCFRRNFFEVLLLIFGFAIFSHPFTRLSFGGIFFSYFVAALFILSLRSQIYTEAYLAYALWVFVLSWLIQVLLYAESYGVNLLSAVLIYASELAFYSFLMSLLSLPMFLLLDLFFEKREREKRKKARRLSF